MTPGVITVIIAIMGALTVLLSIFAAWRFFLHHRNMTGDGKKLSMALFAQLVGEAVIGAVTLTFAALAWTGKLQYVSVEAQSALRFIAFFATSATTIHLSLLIERLHSK